MNKEADKKWDLRLRTKDFALRIIRTYSTLPKRTDAQILGKQMLRSATSVGAHYREATRARSNAEFISKLEVGLQELEETIYWLELLAGSGNIKESVSESIITEATELIKIFVTSVKKVKRAGRK